MSISHTHDLSFIDDFIASCENFARSAAQSTPITGTTPSKKPAKAAVAHVVHDGEVIAAPELPAFNAVTMITINLFDNGAGAKNKRWGINIQFYTQTTPFTPHKRLAAWDGCCSVTRPSRSYDAWLLRYLAMHEVTPEQNRRVNASLGRAQDLDCAKGFPVVGTPMKSIGGKTVYWDCFVSLWQTHDGDMLIELSMPGTDPLVIELEQVLKKNDREADFRGCYDPHGLWLTKAQARKQGGR